MNLQQCPCGQVFAHVPLPGTARDSRCLFCYLPGCDSAQSQNRAGTSASLAIASGNEGDSRPNIENPPRVESAAGSEANKEVPTMATILETRKVRVRVPARSAPAVQVAL